MVFEKHVSDNQHQKRSPKITMRERTKRKKRWLRRLAIVAIVLVVFGVVGWFGIQRAVKSSLEAQLGSFNIGTPQIANVSISMTGIRASDIKFLHSESGREPQAILDALVIHHSLFELITSSPTYDAIDLVGLQIFVEVPGTSDEPMPTIELKLFSLPAKKLNITKSTIVFRDGPDRTFDIREIDLSIISVGDQYETRGVIGSMIGGPWKLDGEIEPKAERLVIELKTDELTLVNHRWQKWPFIPPAIEKTVHGDARMKARLSINSNAKTGLDVQGIANIVTLNLKFPWFDNLPVNIFDGDIEFRNQTIYYKDIIATVDGADQLHGNGETTVDQFPIKSKFWGNFQDLDLRSLRKLVAGIPENVQGKATGDVVGSVDVESSTRSILSISADATCSQTHYGQIKTEPLETETRILDLIFDENQGFESVDGHVAVNGTTVAQPIKNIFETFELTELERRLELEGDFVADVKLQLPLKSISDLTKWHLSVDGRVAEATICDQAISHAHIRAALHAGELHFRPIHLTPLTVAEVEQCLSEQVELPTLDVAVEWPLIDSSTGDDPGRIWVDGQRVSTNWIRRFIDRQIENATGLTREEIDPDRRWSFNMAGQIDFNTDFQIPTQFPDRLELWKGNGTVRNSTVVFDRVELGELSANLGLDRGLLLIRDASGSIESGGQVTATGHIDVRHQIDHQMEFAGRGLPFSWAMMLAADANEHVKKALFDSKIDTAIAQRELAGEFSVDLKLTTDPADDEIPWTIRSDIYSSQLSIGDAIVRNLEIEGFGNSRLIKIDRVHADLDGDGFVDAHGQWILDSWTGDGSIEWRNLPVEWLSRFANLHWFDPKGRTNGKLAIRSLLVANTDPVDRIPIEIDGRVSADQFSIGRFEARPISIDIATREGIVHFDNVRTTDEQFGMNLHAQAALSSPFPFSIMGDIKNGNLSSLIQTSSNSDSADTASDLKGLIAAVFDIDGQMQPFDWRTKGKLALTELSFYGRPASDVTAEWNHLGSDWQQSTIIAQAMGGSIRMTELTRQPEHLQVAIADVDLMQVNSFLGSPFQISGSLKGTASLREWSDSNAMLAKIELQCQAIRVQEFNVRDFTGQAEFRQRNLSYSFDAAVLGGKLDGTGETDLTQFNLPEFQLPLEVRITSIRLDKIRAESRAFRALQFFDGNLSAIGSLNFKLGQSPSGNGLIELNRLSWKNRRLVNDVTARFTSDKGVIAFEDIRADLEQGSITGRVVMPTHLNASGTYDFDFRQLDLGKLTAFSVGESMDVEGQFNARLHGRFDRQVSGQGFVGVQRARFHGLDGQEFRLPVRFLFSPQNQSGRIEVRQSTFRLFDGEASASGTINLGPTLNVESNIQFANVDTGKLLGAIADIEQADQGKMSGRLILGGRDVRSSSDLTGTFHGQLTRASAFELPVIQDMSRFMTGNNIMTQDYNSDEISLRLNKGRIEVKQLNFTNPLAKIAVRGVAYLDGRLNLQVAARIDKLGQPTLIEELAGSPLAGLSGSPVAFFVQASDFLSERVVFLQVNGTFHRPQIRVDTGQQLADEIIRYFLRGSQILPNGLRWND